MITSTLNASNCISIVSCIKDFTADPACTSDPSKIKILCNSILDIKLANTNLQSWLI